MIASTQSVQRIDVQFLVIIPLCCLFRILRLGEPKVVSKSGNWSLGADWIAEVRVPSRDNAPTFGALIVGLPTIVVSVLGAVTPPTSFPERTLELRVVWPRLVALETVGKGRFTSLSFPQDNTCVIRV